jgi:hypothetical protein
LDPILVQPGRQGVAPSHDLLGIDESATESLPQRCRLEPGIGLRGVSQALVLERVPRRFQNKEKAHR